MIGGIYHGVMTYYALKAIREANDQISTCNCAAG
jgi:hypothetical protein